MKLLGTLLGWWGWLPLAGRGLVVVTIVALIYFAITSTQMAAKARAGKGAGGAPQWAETGVGRAVVGLVRDAAQSAKQAGAAKTPTDQLLHIQWGLANLKAARSISQADRGIEEDEQLDAMLSVASGMHVGRLGSYLDRAQALCVERMEKAGGK
jgi:hypothetical protein